MVLSCPTCRSPLSGERACAGGHAFEQDEHVLVLLDEVFARRLAQFTSTLQRYRDDTGRRILEPALYEGLPHSLAGQSFEWKMRVHDLATVERRVGPEPRRILDIGAWNGWLSHNLARRGHRVTAVDYFADPFDGLGARRHYPDPTWRAIQLDLADLSPLGELFDVIVLNRCLAFFPDPVVQLEHARSLLAPGGLLLATGLAFFLDPSEKAREVRERQEDYRRRYDAELFLRPTKGYLDDDDRRALTRAGLRLRADRRLTRANLLAKLRPTRPLYRWGESRAS